MHVDCEKTELASAIVGLAKEVAADDGQFAENFVRSGDGAVVVVADATDFVDAVNDAAVAGCVRFAAATIAGQMTGVVDDQLDDEKMLVLQSAGDAGALSALVLDVDVERVYDAAESWHGPPPHATDCARTEAVERGDVPDKTGVVVDGGYADFADGNSSENAAGAAAADDDDSESATAPDAIGEGVQNAEHGWTGHEIGDLGAASEGDADAELDGQSGDEKSPDVSILDVPAMGPRMTMPDTSLDHYYGCCLFRSVSVMGRNDY